MVLLADSEGPDQIAWMRRLIWAFAIRICSKTRFRMVRPIFIASPFHDFVSDAVIYGISGTFGGIIRISLFSTQSLSLETRSSPKTSDCAVLLIRKYF